MATTLHDMSDTSTIDKTGIQRLDVHSQALRLSRSYQRTGIMNDLDKAIEMMEKEIKTLPKGHPHLNGMLGDLGVMLGNRFEHTGAENDLNRAIEVVDEALPEAEATSPSNPEGTSRLNNLGTLLGWRFERTGAENDLKRSIEAIEKVVAATPLKDPDRASYLANLGNILSRRYERTKAMEDLNYSINITEKAVEATPSSHPGRIGKWVNLGNKLVQRFERTGEIKDLTRAIEVTNKAVTATPSDYPYRALYLNSLGNMLYRRFQTIRIMDDLKLAIEVAEKALEATPVDHPNRAMYLMNLGNRFNTQFAMTRDTEDIDRSLLCFRKGWNCKNAPRTLRIKLAWQAAALLAWKEDWEESSGLLEDAVMLLPTISPRSLQHTDKQHMLREFAGLAPTAAATALNAGKEAHHALGLLELGRGVIAGLLLEMRTDISDLEEKYPELAKEFVSLRDILDSPANILAPPTSVENTLSLEAQVKQRRDADEKFDEIKEKIRAKSEFQSFLRQPTADELMAAAVPGPIVVVNVSSYRCDAFLVEHYQIRSLVLDKLNVEDVNTKAKMLSATGSSLTSILAWLWKVVTQPCLEALGFEKANSDNNWDRVWWIPTGALSYFPLHAAGCHFDNSKETVLDRVMSSYSSSIKALIHGRRQSDRNPERWASEKALLVGMQETPDQSALRFAKDEVKMLEKLSPSLQLKPVMLPHQQQKDVLEHLRTCKIFHFAGHGLSDPLDPSRSCLLLEDWKTDPLTVEALRDGKHWLRDNPPFSAYLSACSTGTNKLETLTDESIHLINACQLAGFCHVVGTLWEVDDEWSFDAAREMYTAVIDNGWNNKAMALGVHNAARFLLRNTRDPGGGVGCAIREEGNPYIWAAYIHVGP